MFRITQDPSSGSDKLYLTEITYNGSNVLIMCVFGVWRHIVDLLCVCVRCDATYTHTRFERIACGWSFTIRIPFLRVSVL